MGLAAGFLIGLPVGLLVLRLRLVGVVPRLLGTASLVVVVSVCVDNPEVVDTDLVDPSDTPAEFINSLLTLLLVVSMLFVVYELGVVEISPIV